MLREDFNYWDGTTFVKTLDKKILPYFSPDDFLGYQIDFDHLLPDGNNKIIKDGLEFIKTGNLDCMMIVNAKAATRALGDIASYVVDKWKNRLSAGNHLYKIDYATRININGESEMDYFTLTFATWHKIFLTGQIVVR